MTYTENQKREHIRELQQYLFGISLYNKKIPQVIPDGIYGATTTNAVRVFQEDYNLPITGEVDRATWEKLANAYNHYVNTPPSPVDIFPSPSYILKMGDEGALVYIVQVMLNYLSREYENLNRVEINGKYDNSTANTVRQFQSFSRHPANGMVDKYTWNMLAKAFEHKIVH